MNLKKRELIISIIMIIMFLVFGLTIISNANSVTYNADGTRNTQGQNSLIEQIGTNSISYGNVSTTNNSSYGNIATVTNTNSNNSNSVNNSTMPYTGAEDLPWLFIVICGVSAVFAYKKIKEYNID